MKQTNKKCIEIINKAKDTIEILNLKEKCNNIIKECKQTINE